MNDIKNVCVYSASSTKIAKEYFDAAGELGRLLDYHNRFFLFVCDSQQL